jgi:hypothetical protein
MYSNSAHYGYPMDERRESQQGYSDNQHQQQQYYDSVNDNDDGYPAYPVRFSRYELGNVAPRSNTARYNPAEYAHDTSSPSSFSAPASARNSLVMQDMRSHNPNNPYSHNPAAYDDAFSSTTTFVEKSPALSGGSTGWKTGDSEKKRQNNKLGGAWPAPAQGLLDNHDHHQQHSGNINNNDYDNDEDDDGHQIGMNWKRPNRKVLYTIIGIVAREPSCLYTFIISLLIL